MTRKEAMIAAIAGSVEWDDVYLNDSMEIYETVCRAANELDQWLDESAEWEPMADKLGELLGQFIGYFKRHPDPTELETLAKTVASSLYDMTEASGQRTLLLKVGSATLDHMAETYCAMYDENPSVYVYADLLKAAGNAGDIALVKLMEPYRDCGLVQVLPR